MASLNSFKRTCGLEDRLDRPKNLLVQLDYNDYKDLDMLALKYNISKGKVVRKFIKEFLEQHRNLLTNKLS